MRSSSATQIDAFADGPGKTAKVVIWQDGAAGEFELQWGFPPFEPGGKPISLLRSEGRVIDKPCLVIANEFFVRPDGFKQRYRVSLITDELFFCFAGVWRPKSRDWPASFAALTVPASPDIAKLKDRQMAVVRPDDWQDWLHQSRPVEELLRPFPPGSFRVIPPNGKALGDLFDR